MVAYFPSRRKPVSLAKINRGLISSRTSGPSPSLSKTPGRNGSIETSACGMRRKMNSLPGESLRSTQMDDFPLIKTSGLGEWPGWTRSTLNTFAPLSARRRPVNGPGASPANSSTRMLSRTRILIAEASFDFGEQVIELSDATKDRIYKAESLFKKVSDSNNNIVILHIHSMIGDLIYRPVRETLHHLRFKFRAPPFSQTTCTLFW